MYLNKIKYIILKDVLFYLKLQMKFILIAIFCLISFSTEETSGIKAAFTSNIFKLFTKFDLNSLVQNMTVTDRAETSGKYLFNYDVVCENLWIRNII